MRGCRARGTNSVDRSRQRTDPGGTESRWTDLAIAALSGAATSRRWTDLRSEVELLPSRQKRCIQGWTAEARVAWRVELDAPRGSQNSEPLVGQHRERAAFVGDDDLRGRVRGDPSGPGKRHGAGRLRASDDVDVLDPVQQAETMRNEVEVQDNRCLPKDQDHADEAAQPSDKPSAAPPTASHLEAGGLVVHAGRKAPRPTLDKRFGFPARLPWAFIHERYPRIRRRQALACSGGTGRHESNLPTIGSYWRAFRILLSACAGLGGCARGPAWATRWVDEP